MRKTSTMKHWKKTTLAAAIAGAIAPWGAHAQTIEVTQSGDANRLETVQAQVAGASIEVGQSGVGATVSIRQSDGAAGASAQVVQDSLGGSVVIEQSRAAHSAVVSQTADGEGSLARIIQGGGGDAAAPSQANLLQQQTAASTAEIRQMGTTAATATLEQTGTRSGLASIWQMSGNGAQAVVRQVAGTSSEVRVSQMMSGTRVLVEQKSSDASFASVSQVQATEGATIRQILNQAAHASIDQATTASPAEITQQSNTSTSAGIRQVYTTGSAKVFQRTNLDTTAQVEQEFAGTGASIFVDQVDNRTGSASATQRRGVAGSTIDISQNSNERVGATAVQEGMGGGGPAPMNRASQIRIEQLGNRDSNALVTQTAGTHQAQVTQTGNAGVQVVVQQFATGGQRAANVTQAGNSVLSGVTALTQQGGNGLQAEVVQQSNTVGTLQAGVLQTTSGDTAGRSAGSGAFVAGDFLPPPNSGSWLGDNLDNTAQITQTGNTGGSVSAGIAMLGVSSGIASVTQSGNAGDTLGLVRMVGVRGAESGIIQRDNAAGTQAVALIEQVAVDGVGAGGRIALLQEGNTAGEVWMSAAQAGADGSTISGIQQASASVHAYLRQEPGSSGSAATIEQRRVSSGQALIRQGTGDGAVDAGLPGSATALIGLLNTDPGPGRGAASASTATLMQSDGAQLSAGIVQTGSGLTALITQSGVWKEASIIQNGVGHQANIVQGGTAVGAQASAVEIRQYGAVPLAATITQQSAGSRIAIVQQ
jgi:hypothetical protein